MEELKRFYQFIDERRDLYSLMTKKPEKIPCHIRLEIPRNQDYEQENRFLLRKVSLPDKSLDKFLFLLSQLHRFGQYPPFQQTRVLVNHKKAAYCLLQAFAHNNRPAFEFLHSMVPECFIENTEPKNMLCAIASVLSELDFVSANCASLQEKMKVQEVACRMVDLIYFPQFSEEDFIIQALKNLNAIDTQVEPNQAHSGKVN